jgi:hypothetical protein
LVEVLPFGVAYHHGGLPTDLLEALEEALRIGTLGWMVATSTLTEGVNLPVRTVVIAETRYDGQPVEAQLRGARLVNAMGRAGRATQESEGWVVLCRNAAPASSDFSLLTPDDDQLRVKSQLGSEDALRDLAAFEDEARAMEDAVFRHVGEHVRGFIAYTWFVLASEGANSEEEVDDLLTTSLSRLFGFMQLDPPTRKRWRAVAAAAGSTFIHTDPERRAAWSKTGTSIGTARKLDEFTDRVVAKLAALADTVDPRDPYDALSIIDGTGFLADVFALPESPRAWGFRAYASANLVQYVAPRELAADWLGGLSLPELANKHLADISKVDVRVEQMVDVVTELFEHFLSWMLGVLVDAVNLHLVQAGEHQLLCPDLPLYIRYGVDSSAEITLATAGVRSRRLLHAVSTAATEAGRQAELEDWLSSMSIADWRERFAATTVDIFDLLDFTRAKSGTLLPDLLETGRAELVVEPTGEAHAETATSVRLEVVAEDPLPQRLGLFDSRGDLIAVVPPRDHGSVSGILDTGLPLTIQLQGALLSLALLDDL